VQYFQKVAIQEPPDGAVLQSWVLDSWKRVNHANIRNPISSAGFSNDFKQWHIAKHNVYRNEFIQAWKILVMLRLVQKTWSSSYKRMSSNMNKKLCNLTFKHDVYRNDFM